MNMFDQLNAAFNSHFNVTPTAKPRSGNPSPTHKPWLSRQLKVEKAFRDVLTGNTMTTAEIANKVGRSHITVLQQMYKYEQRNLVRRVGTVPRPEGSKPGRGQIIWAWNEQH
jgi:hypothetical protein